MDSRFPIESWLPDESLFSLCSRAHQLICVESDAATCERWFGDQRQGIQHDFPCNLEIFSKRTQGFLGSPIHIAQTRTMLPYFAPFQSPERIQTAIDTMLGSRVGFLKYRLGLITGRFGAAHPLKACRACILDEIGSLGFTYWHLEHQYPGVIICNRHRTQLQESTLKRIWSGRFTWCLPRQNELIETDRDLGSALLPAMQLATNCSELAGLAFSRWLDPQILRDIYVKEITGENEANARSLYLPREQVDSFLDFTEYFRPFRPFDLLPKSREDAEKYLRYLLRSPRSHSHPLRHLLVISWRFGSIKNFIDTYDLIASQNFIKSKLTKNPAVVRNAFNDDGVLQSSKASARPKVLKAVLRHRTLRLLTKGIDKNTVCLLANVTISTINKLLRSEPKIKEAWKVARESREIAKRRANWLACLAANPGCSTKAIRNLCAETYAWLYRNDQNWLFESLKKLPSGRKGNHSKIDWPRRDRELACRLMEMADSMLVISRKRRLTRKEIFQALPTLPYALRYKDKYPITYSLFLKILNI